MRKLIFSALILGFCTMQLPAGVFRLGVKGGFNATTLLGNWEDLEEYRSAELGFNGGVSFGFSGGKTFEFQPELLISQKGVRFEKNEFMSQIEQNYFEIPLLFKWNFGSGSSKVRGFFNAGPYTAFLLNSEYTESVNDEEYSESAKEDMNKVDVGLILGGGIGVKAGAGRFIVDLRYSLGFVDVISANDDDISYDDVYLNGLVGIMVGYSFEFGNSSK